MSEQNPDPSNESDHSARAERMRLIFVQAIELPESERAAFIRNNCQDDAAMADEIEDLPLESAIERKPPTFRP